MDCIIKIDLDNTTDFNFPIGKPIGLEITYNNKKYEFILKLSKNNNLIVFCEDYEDIQILMKNPAEFLNQDDEINRLNEIIIQKDNEIAEITSSKEAIINNLNDLVIRKDNVLNSVTAKLDEINLEETFSKYEGLKLENDEKEKKIQEITNENKALTEEIGILKSTIEKDESNLNSIFEEINLLKSIIAEKDKTIDSLRGGD